MRAVAVLLVLAIPVSARADWLSRAVDKAAPAGPGGGTTTPAEPNFDDLIAWAGEPRPITLPQLLQIAVKQAPTLQNARLDIAVAEAQIVETWARHDLLIGGKGYYTKQLQLLGGFPLDEHAYGGSLDISRALPTGGSIDLHTEADFSHNTFVLGMGLPPSTTETWQETVSLTLQQSLLRGRGVWLYDAQERKAQLSRDVYVLARRSAAINTVQTVISAYWDLVLAERQVAITQASLDLAKERLRVTQIGAKGGKIAEAEIPAVEQIIATREEDVLNGELAVLNASIALRRAAGMPIGSGELGLRVATDYDIRQDTPDLKKLVGDAFNASPELAELAKQQQGATIDIEVTENGLLPQLDAALTLGPTAQESQFSTGAQDIYQLKNMSVSGTLTFSQSVGRHQVKGRIHELEADRDKLRVNAIDIRAQVAQAMSRAVSELELAKRRVQLSQRAIELAKQNIKIETDRFNLGTRTNFDVLNRLEELRQAELREAQAKIDWHKADATVMALTGDILPAFGITVQ
jgi:outer membrane protein TolC